MNIVFLVFSKFICVNINMSNRTPSLYFIYSGFFFKALPGQTRVSISYQSYLLQSSDRGVGAGWTMLSLVLLNISISSYHYQWSPSQRLNINMTLDNQLVAEYPEISDTTSLSTTNVGKRSLFLEKCRVSSVQSYPLHIKQDAGSYVD